MKKLVICLAALSSILMACSDDKGSSRDDNPSQDPSLQLGDTIPECSGVTTYGVCDDKQLLSYCDVDNKQVVNQDCKALNMDCGTVIDPNGTAYKACVDRSACTSAGVTEKGSCKGDVVTYCDFTPEAYTVAVVDCKKENKVCGLVTKTQGEYYDCVEDKGTGSQPGTKPEEKPLPSNCGEVTEVGSCSGDTVTYCDVKGDKVVTENCASQKMSCGLVIEDEGDSYNACVDKSACTSAGVTEVGTCKDDVITYCDFVPGAYEVATVDCKEKGKVCGLVDLGNGEVYDCVAKTEGGTKPEDKPSEPGKVDFKCSEIGSRGTCDGKVLYYCNDAKDTEVLSMNCGASNGVCALDPVANQYDCYLPCGEVTSEGTCDDGVLKYCGVTKDVKGQDIEVLSVVNCKDQSKTCGKNASNQYDCI